MLLRETDRTDPENSPYIQQAVWIRKWESTAPAHCLSVIFFILMSEFGDLLAGGTRYGFSSQPGKAVFFPTEDEGHYRPTGSAFHCHT